MIDLQKRMGLVPDAACSGVLSPERPNCGWLKPSEQAPIPELAARRSSELSLANSLSGVRGKNTPGRLSSCPRCAGQLIQTPGPWLVCQDCEHFTISLTTLNAVKPSGVHVLLPSSSMVQPNHEGDSKCRNILAVGEQ